MWCFDCDAYYCTECHDRPHVLSLSAASARHCCFPIEGASGKMLGKGAWAGELLAETKAVFRLRRSEGRGVHVQPSQQTTTSEPLRADGTNKEVVAPAAANASQASSPPSSNVPEPAAARTTASQSTPAVAVNATSESSTPASSSDGSRVQTPTYEARKRKLPLSDSNGGQDNFSKELHSTHVEVHHNTLKATPLVDRIHRVSVPEMSLYEQVRRMHDKRQQRDHRPPLQPTQKPQNKAMTHLPSPASAPQKQTKKPRTTTTSEQVPLAHRPAAAQTVQVPASAQPVAPAPSSGVIGPSASPKGIAQQLQQQQQSLQRVVTSSVTAAMIQQLQQQQQHLQRVVSGSVTSTIATASPTTQPLPPAPASSAATTTTPTDNVSISAQSSANMMQGNAQTSDAERMQQSSSNGKTNVPEAPHAPPSRLPATQLVATVDLAAAPSAAVSTKPEPTQPAAQYADRIPQSLGVDEDALLAAVFNDYNKINTYVLTAENTIQEMAKAVRGLSYEDVAKAARLNEAITDKRVDLNEAKARRTQVTARVMMYLPAVSNFAKSAKPGDWGDVPQVLTVSHARLLAIATDMAATEDRVRRWETMIDDAVSSGDMERIQQVPELGQNIKREEKVLEAHRTERDNQFVLMLKFSRELRATVQREVAALQARNAAAMKE